MIVTGDDVESLVPEGSLVDVTLKANSSDIMVMEVYFPALDFTVEKTLDTSKKQSIEDAAKQISVEIGKEPVQVEEAPGFVVNRILIPMINEAIGIYAEGVASVEGIDQAMKLGANHPMGPLALGDLVGLDIVLAIMNVLYDETGDTKYRPHPLLKKMVRAGKLGKKTGIGFYNYAK